tara:strand:+ start:423 stop:614 length:192 start_codon:yes stop_codon:yes gene_type:complete
MDKNINAMSTKNKALKSGWTGYTSSIYSFIELKPLPSQKYFIQHQRQSEKQIQQKPIPMIIKK